MDIDIDKSDLPKFSINGTCIFVAWLLNANTIIFKSSIDDLWAEFLDGVSFTAVEICSNAAWTSPWWLYSIQVFVFIYFFCSIKQFTSNGQWQ